MRKAKHTETSAVVERKTVWNYITQANEFDSEVNTLMDSGWILENSGILSFNKPEETILYATMRRRT